jgi:hypothetical protein
MRSLQELEPAPLDPAGAAVELLEGSDILWKIWNDSSQVDDCRAEVMYRDKEVMVEVENELGASPLYTVQGPQST